MKERNSRDQSGPGPQEVLITLREAYVRTLLFSTRKSINLHPTTTDEANKGTIYFVLYDSSLAKEKDGLEV